MMIYIINMFHYEASSPNIISKVPMFQAQQITTEVQHKRVSGDAQKYTAFIFL